MYICWFPETGVPRNHPFYIIGFSLINHPFLGYLHFRKLQYCSSAKTNWFDLRCFLVFFFPYACTYWNVLFVSMCVCPLLSNMFLCFLIVYVSMSSRICQYVEQFSLCYCFPSLLFDLFSMSFQLFLYMFICFAEQTCSLYSVHMISIMLKTFSKIDQEFLHMIYHDFIYPNTFSAIIPSPKCRIPYYHFSTPQPYWFDIWKKNKT